MVENARRLLLQLFVHQCEEALRKSAVNRPKCATKKGTNFGHS